MNHSSLLLPEWFIVRGSPALLGRDAREAEGQPLQLHAGIGSSERPVGLNIFGSAVGEVGLRMAQMGVRRKI
jgi:hypothetical protein